MALHKALKDLIEEIRKQTDLTEEQIEEKLNKALGETHVPKSVFNEKTEAEKQAKAKITEYETQIADLKKAGNLTAEQKTKIDELTAKLTQQEKTYQTELKATKHGYAIEDAIRGAKGRNAKAIRALLDESKIAWSEDGTAGNLKEQLDSLKKDNGYLFESDQELPKGTKPSFGGPAGGASKPADALSSAFDTALGLGGPK